MHLPYNLTTMWGILLQNPHCHGFKDKAIWYVSRNETSLWGGFKNEALPWGDFKSETFEKWDF